LVDQLGARSERRWPALDITLRDGEADADGQLEGQLLAFLDDHSPTAVTAPPGDDAGWQVTASDASDATPAWLADPETAEIRISTPAHAWRVFFPSPEARAAARAALTTSVWGERCVLAEVDVEDEGWAERSQAALKAVQVGALIVAPPWDLPDTREGARLVVIEPSMGFGTGHHQSTRLCLQALQSIDLAGLRVLDLGTGSGVLAIAAAVLGAESVLALDDDRDAVDAAQGNVQLNGVEARVRTRQADLTRLDPAAHVADVVLANLTGALLRRYAAIITACLAPHGRLIVAGFTQDERIAVAHALGLQQLGEGREDGWMSLTLLA
jgi:ribosomal protein L11 methyltransferase